jgi:prevent-host-death family protein
MARKKRCGSEEARARLPELLDAASRGQSTVITRRGKPYAALVPLDALARGGRRVAIASLRGTGSGLYGDDVRAELARLRDEWE